MAMSSSKWTWEEETGQLVMREKGIRGLQIPVQTKLLVDVASPQNGPEPDRVVTLEDVKSWLDYYRERGLTLDEFYETSIIVICSCTPGVAVNLISEDSVLSVTKNVAKLFDRSFRTDQMNTLLRCSLLFYSTFLSHKEASDNENLSVSGTLGESARSELQMLVKELRQTQINLGQAYSKFILGLENTDVHHSKGGISRVSSTHTDKMFFEILYEFVMLCVWVCFEYENWEVIHTQLGRFFRTDAFNRELQVSEDGNVEVQGLGSVSKKSDEYLAYKVCYDRPPVGLLKRLRSPAMVAFMPYPDEFCSADQSRCADHSDNIKVGILGEKMSLYDPQSLRLLEISEKDSSFSNSHISEDT